MASTFPNASYGTEFKALTNGSKTDCVTVPTGHSYGVTGITVCASTGSAANATVHIYDASATTEYVLCYQGVVGANFPLMIEGAPIWLNAADVVRVTGANLQHVFVTYLKTTSAANPAAT